MAVTMTASNVSGLPSSQPVQGKAFAQPPPSTRENPHCMSRSAIQCIMDRGCQALAGSSAPVAALCPVFHWLCGRASASAAPARVERACFFISFPVACIQNPQPLRSLLLLLFLSLPLCVTLRAFLKRSSCIYLSSIIIKHPLASSAAGLPSFSDCLVLSLSPTSII